MIISSTELALNHQNHFITKPVTQACLSPPVSPSCCLSLTESHCASLLPSLSCSLSLRHHHFLSLLCPSLSLCQSLSSSVYISGLKLKRRTAIFTSFLSAILFQYRQRKHNPPSEAGPVCVWQCAPGMPCPGRTEQERRNEKGEGKKEKHVLK